MENNTTKFERFCIGVVIALLCFLTVTIAARFLSKQILIEKLHWDNVITRTIWFDNSAAGAFGSNDTDAEGSSVTIDIDWKTLYPFTESDIASANIETDGYNPISSIHKKLSKVVNLIQSVEEEISTYTENLLVGYNFEVSLAKKYNTCLGVDGISNLSNDSDILYLDNGYLTYIEPAVADDDINEIADSVADFSNYLNNQGIGFCYVNAGSKVCPYDRQTMYVDSEHTNENGDALLEALSERDVKFLDMREKMIDDGLDWYDSYYVTDHHWKTETGLWAAKQIGIYLNNEFGFEFDLDKFNPSEYDMKTTDNFWLGGQGRVVTFANADLESYTKIIPKYDTNFHIEVPSRNVSKNGSYEDALFDNSVYNAVFDYSESEHLSKVDAYHSVTWRNDALGTIRNTADNSNKGKKILFIEDSFSWYSTTFIACDIESVDIINPCSFTGSIRSYINESKPDMVVMMMCERNIKPIANLDHSDMFELK